MSKLAVAMATTVASLASGPKPTCEPFATINPQHDGIYWRFAPMRIVGPNGFKAAAFIHDKKVISATRTSVGAQAGRSIASPASSSNESGRSSATTTARVPASDRDRSDLLYISRPHDGLVYFAERSRKGSQKLLWSVIPREPFGPELRVDATDVPREIRRQAYRHLGKVTA